MLQNVTYSALPVNIESPLCDPMTPKGTDILTPGQCRAARAWLNWSAEELGDRAKVHRMTVQRFESEESSPIAATIQQIRDALEEAGIEFVGTNGIFDRREERSIPIESPVKKKSGKRGKSDGAPKKKEGPKPSS